MADTKEQKIKRIPRAERDGKRGGKRAEAVAEAPAPVKDNAWRDRWVRRDHEDPAQLLANELNWRGHPRYQQMAMMGVLETLGWLDEVKVNINTGKVFNGHMRCEIAISEGEATVPVSYYDLTAEEEKMALATFDPLSSLAFIASKENYSSLAGLAGVKAASKGLLALVRHQAGEANIQTAFETDFLTPFLNSTSTSAGIGDGAAAASDGATGVVDAPGETGSNGGGATAANGAALIEADPGAVVTAEYQKVIFNFLTHQKRNLFNLLNEQRQARNLPPKPEMTDAEVLLILLGVSLTDENS
jgi:hypothetical protein